ncbi:acyl-coenzyme A synthetase/AMP-(fatty) acid ligase/acyl carrier protein [Nocardioides marinisabuli]|uniref:Acyl-coenzyme A synthetase/AMP-(Fatty) acid ligase/acyl carrier protein n=1 Tax=Nocardioides marinisabuli TaxID=419476 RepID=A0A7Y9JS68_9ACTN|nr:AMP-binding protein [Nocardioides marinisabuli]NYD57444.1 acyl-coenzyme A synthetase/AMP-(fatty) acid ligase/acyl carrier protein [Nocardioides marinisabuli]
MSIAPHPPEHSGSPAAAPATGVGFARDLASWGARRALVHAGRVVSYADLARLVDDRAARLGPVRRLVLLEMASDVDSVATYLAALAGGHPVVVVDAARPDVVAATRAAYDPDVVARGDVLDEQRDGTAHDLHPELAALLSTSGSTGSPRLVRLSAENLQANAESIAAYLPLRGDDLAALSLSLHYCYGLSVLHTHLLRGAGVLLGDASVVDPCFWAAAREHGATSLAGVPHTFELLDRVGLDTVAPDSLRYLTQAGGAMAPDRVRSYAELGQRRGFDLFVMYGQTEATARMAYLPPDLAGTRPGAIGVPVPGGRFDLAEVPGAPEGTGELVYEGPNVMLGYAEHPDDLARGREVTRLRTGDLARRGDDGLWEVVGRLSRTAKVLGLRIDLDRVERALVADGVRALVAGTPPTDGATEQLVVAVEPRATGGSARLVARVRRLVTALTGLPAAAVQVHPVPQLPRLANGKPDHRGVAALAAPAPERATTAATGVRDVLGEVLGRPVGDDDTFAGLGGDSLTYVETSVRLEEALGHLPADWHLRTVAELEAGTTTRTRRGRGVETNVVLRAVAIVAVVGTHADLFTLLGGAHLLLALAGFNLARFALGDVTRRERVQRLLTAAARVVVPAVLWIGGTALLLGAYPWQTALLVNGFLGPPGWTEPAWHHWFVEALVLLVLGVAALVAVPVLDRTERRWPFWFPVALTLLALLTRYELVPLPDGDVIHRAPVVAWLLTLGWAVARARTTGHRLVVSALAVLTVPGFFADDARSAAVIVGLLLLTWSRQVRLPGLLARLAATLAGASLYIYLTHWQVYPHLEDDLPALATLLSLVVGVAVWRAVTTTERRLRR